VLLLVFRKIREPWVILGAALLGMGLSRS
jgi:hypothetical protein